jgi:kynurenine formamidase
MMQQPPSLWPWLEGLSHARFVDLTHAFDENIPHCESFQPASRTTLFSHRRGEGTLGHGFLAHEYRHVGQWGTHVDPGAHFVEGRRFLDEIPVSEMVLPLVVIDVQRHVQADPDYCIRLDDVLEWESRHGRLPPRAFIAKRSGWSRRWPSQARMMNRDAQGVAHFPGWSLDVLRLLFEERRAIACGHETTDTDSGISISRGDVSLERYVLDRDAWQIELLALPDDLPEAGSVVIASWPKPKTGSGFPARVFAIVPEEYRP